VTEIFRASVVDPAGDPRIFAPSGISPDLIGGLVVVTSDKQVSFTASFLPGTFQKSATRVQWDLDLDEIESTGFASDGQGVDYIISLGSDYHGSEARVSKLVQLNGFDDWPLEMGRFPVTFGTDSIEVRVPLATLAGDDGRFRFRVTASTQLTANGFTSPLDFMPDRDLAAGVVR
jgi:hypothetical protein